MFLSALVFSAALAGTDIKILHNDRTENFYNCMVMRDTRMSSHGGLHYVCNAPTISPREYPRYQSVGDWSYYITDGILVWERDSRCGFVESVRSEWSDYEKITISCWIPQIPARNSSR